MAGAIVYLAVQKIWDLLIHEADFLGGVNDEVVRMRAELDRSMQTIGKTESNLFALWSDKSEKQDQTQMQKIIVSLAIQRIIDLLIEEADFLGGVRDEMERLRAELDRMNSMLKDADYKQDQTQFVRTLVRQIRDLPYEGEDVSDAFCNAPE